MGYASLSHFRTFNRSDPPLLACLAIDPSAEVVCAASHTPSTSISGRYKPASPRPLAGHEGPILTLAFTPDGRNLLSPAPGTHNPHLERIRSLADFPNLSKLTSDLSASPSGRLPPTRRRPHLNRTTHILET